MIETFPKFRYSVVEKYGDLYYQELSVKETMEKAFHFEEDPSKTLKNMEEVDMWVRDNI